MEAERGRLLLISRGISGRIRPWNSTSCGQRLATLVDGSQVDNSSYNFPMLSMDHRSIRLERVRRTHEESHPLQSLGPSGLAQTSSSQRRGSKTIGLEEGSANCCFPNRRSIRILSHGESQ